MRGCACQIDHTFTFPQDRVQQQTDEHNFDFEECVEVVSLTPPENVQQPIDEQIVELLMPQIMTVIVEVFKSVKQEQILQNLCAAPPLFGFRCLA